MQLIRMHHSISGKLIKKNKILGFGTSSMIHECLRLLPVLHHVKQQSPIMRPRGLCRAKTVLTTWIGISFIQFIPCKPSQPGKAYLRWRSILIHLLGIWEHGRMLQRKENLLNLSTQAEKHCVKLSQSHKMLMKPSTSSLISCNLGLWEDMLMQDEAASCIDHPSISIASLLVCVTPNLHRACTRRRTCLRCHWDTRRAKRRHKRSCKVGSSKVWFLRYKKIHTVRTIIFIWSPDVYSLVTLHSIEPWSTR